MKDDLAFNIKFIELVHERPCLYDYTRPDYSNRNAQDASWLEIAKTVEESVADCKERWKNLRGCYTRHLKNNNKPSGSSAKHVKPYYLADHLQFLDRYTKSRQSKGIFNKEEQNTEIHQETPSEIYDEHELSHEFNNPPPAISVTNEIEACSQETDNFSRPNKVKRKKVSLSEVNAAAKEYFQSRQKISKQNENQDPDFAFFYSLIPDVKDMNRDQKRRFKMGVLKLANDILQENISQEHATMSTFKPYMEVPKATYIATGPESPISVVNSTSIHPMHVIHENSLPEGNEERSQIYINNDGTLSIK